MLSRISIITSLLSLTSARDITFPPVHPVEQYTFNVNGKDDPALYADFKEPFYGLTTFANLPYVHCLADKSNDEVERFDIAVLGAGFDTGVTARPGARYGPTGIRLGSRRISPAETSIYTGRNVFKEWAKIIDCGDAPLTFLDNTVALKQLTKAHEIVSGRGVNKTFEDGGNERTEGVSGQKGRKSVVPRILTLGGDHTTTLPALRSVAKHFGPVSVLHFDSHIDTWDPQVLGGGVSHYAGINHGTFLHIAHEEGLLLNDTNLHVGIRAPVLGRGDVKNDRRCGFHVVTARDLDHLGVRGVVERIRERVNGTMVYVSVDIDVLDPAFAPATGTAEVGGWSTRELLSILDGLTGLKVVGADVVEVAPIYDNPGEVTVLAAAQVALSLLTLMVDTPVFVDA